MAGPRPAGVGHGGHFLTDEEKKNSPKVTPELLARVFSWLKPYWKQMILVIVCIAAASVLKILPSVLTLTLIHI